MIAPNGVFPAQVRPGTHRGQNRRVARFARTTRCRVGQAVWGQTRTLNQAVRRNQRCFPADFLVEATTAEWVSLRSQIVILDKGRGRFSKFPPLAFTEHGAIMAATVLNSPRAVEMSVYVVRAFIKLRELLASNAARWSGNLDACATFRINNLLLRVQSFPTGTWCQP